MRNRLLLLLVILIAFNKVSFAQIIAGQGYLQGHWLEIGEIQNASFGADPPPATYHPHCSGCAPTYTTCPGCPIGEVYDYGHDGWGVGAPAFMGDYTLPGSPFEGWEIQINGQRNQAYEYGGYTGSCGPCGTLTASGGLTYSNSGGKILCNWAGTASVGGGLTIQQETRVDTTASWVVVTTKFYNTTALDIPNVYYFRSADPDNDESWPGGAFPTTNTIVYQNTDREHRVLVSAYGQLGTYTMMGLGTKDPRAVCMIYNSWGLSGTVDLATVYNKTYGPADYTQGTNDNGDIAMGLVYYLCSIPAHDSEVISYAYIFGAGVATHEIDSAFPDPQLIINDSLIPNNVNDTFNACDYPNQITLNVGLNNTDKTWEWTSWSWLPTTGLTVTTGTSGLVITISDLSEATTYTVTGLDTSFCERDTTTLTFTVLPCAAAHNNSPCYGDSLKLSFLGNDTVGATFYWYGPGGYTSVLRNPVIYPASFADSGEFYVVKTIGSIHDTFKTHVIIHPLPVLDVASNIPLCGPLVDSLLLSVTPDSTGELFSWSGPNGFTSNLEFPVIMPFDSTGTGTYFVHATTQYGCKNSGSVNVYPGIVPGFTFDRHYGCNFDTVYFTNTSSNANGYSWNFGDGTPTDANRNTYHVYSTHDMFYVKLSLSNPHCDSSITLPVDLRHGVKALFSPIPDTICYGQSTTLMDSSYSYLHYGFVGLSSYVWNFGDGSSDATFTPTHTYPTPGVYPVTLVVTDSIGCEDSLTKDVYVLELSLTSFDTTLCISQPLPMTNILSVIPDITLNYTYQWNPGTDLSDSTVQIPNFYGLGLITYTLTVNVNPTGCPVSAGFVINSVLGKVLTDVTPTTTITLGSSIQLNADSEVLYWWKPNDGSLDNPNINDPIATPTTSTLYTVYGYDVNGCLDSAYVDIIVDSSMDEGLPEGFTPNGDGLNDVFKPIGQKFQKLVDFRIYNRWGQQLFYSNSFNSGWDGTFNGVPQEMGVYFYSITVARPGGDGANIVYKGEVTLIR